MSAEFYLIDGKRLTGEETKNLFTSRELGKREQVCLSLIENSPNQTIVDLGCLYGIFGSVLSKKFPSSEIIAGDYDEENLKIARFLNPEVNSIYKHLNAYQMDFRDKVVDVVVFQEVIEHLEGAAQAVKEINRVLKLGGNLIISTPTPYYWKDMWACFKYELARVLKRKKLALSAAVYFQEHEWNRHIYCWTPSTLYTLLKVNGFEYIDHQYCQDGKGLFEKVVLKVFPFLSPTIILKVKKTSEASANLV